MAESSKDLLGLEIQNFSTSTIESALLVCKNDGSTKPQNSKSKCLGGKPVISSVPRSQVLGQVKDFLGVISDSNRRLQNSAKDNSNDFNIEVLTGNEPEYIEMDLMLGVADLHTPEAVAAAESAIAGYQPVISLADSSSSGAGSEYSSKADSDGESDNDSEEDNSSGGGSSRKWKSRKRSKIVELT